MIKQKMKVGPKGQVVIPKIFRENLKIGPGSEVEMSVVDSKLVVERHDIDPIAVFRSIAAKMKGKKIKIDSDRYYNERMEERWKRKHI